MKGENTLKEKINTKKLATIALLTALYCVLSAMMKIPFIGAISLDLGYIALTVACGTVDVWAGIVGAVGCGIESMLFSPYGFSISWCMANLAVGLICGSVLHMNKHTWAKALVIIIGVAVGMLAVKTAIECHLYAIPLAVKIPKNAVAFAADTVTMLFGLGFYQIAGNRIKIARGR